MGEVALKKKRKHEVRMFSWEKKNKKLISRRLEIQGIIKEVLQVEVK